MVNEHYEPSDREEEILELLKEGREDGGPWGRSNPAYLSEQLDERRQYINRSLQNLVAAGWLRKRGKGLYEFVEDPRE
jgi:DNA-binding IclR family transcriptional regulator